MTEVQAFSQQHDEPPVQPAFHRLGQHALVASFEAPATLAAQQRIWAVAREAASWPEVAEAVAGMNNLTLFLAQDGESSEIQARLENSFRQCDPLERSGREVVIPVRYGGQHGPDLAAVARHTGLDPEEVVARHAAPAYVVFFVGFQAGFPYLGGLDPALATPRLATPRMEVPAGSVGIGGAQTGVYPLSGPGGWQLIGRTELNLFDPARTPAALLAAGDIVRFEVQEIAP